MPQIQWQPGFLSHCILAVGVVLSMLILLRGLRGESTIIQKIIALIRLLVIAMIVVAGYMPSIIQMVPAAASKQVVLIVDDSKSMSITDSNLSLAEIVLFGESVGAIDPGAIVSSNRQLVDPVNKLLAIIIEQKNPKFDAQSQSQVVQIVDSIKGLIHANSSFGWTNPALGRIEEQLNSQGNVMEIGKIVRQLKGDLIERLNRDYSEYLEGDEDLRDVVDRLQQSTRFSLARQAASSLFASLSREMLVELRDLQLPIRPADLPAMQPLEPESLINKTLRQVVERSGLQMPDGIIMLTDGRNTEMRSTISPALIASGVPVYPVMMVSSSSQPDVRILGIDTPGIALKGETIDVVVRIRPRSADGQPATVKLSDHRTTMTRTINLGTTDASVRFEYPAIHTGTQQLEVTIDPLAGESHEENNVAIRDLNVVDQPMTVSILHQNDSDEIKSLIRQLSDIPWLKVDDNRLDHKPQIIILNHPASLNVQQVGTISSLVLEQGKSLVILETPASELSSIFTQPAWQKLLPQMPGNKEPIRNVDQDAFPSLNQLILGNNRLEWHGNATQGDRESQVKLKQIADLTQLVKYGFPILSETKSKMPLLIGIPARNGKIVISGATGTSQWSSEDSNRFWGKLLRGLIDWPIEMKDRDLELWVDHQEITQGDSINIIASTNSPSAGSVQILQKLSDQSVESLSTFEPFPGSGQWFARATPRLAGECTFTFHQGSTEVRKTLIVKPDLDAEMRDVAPDEGFMRRIAAATGGEVFSIDQIAQIPSSINRRISTQTRRVERNIWCSQYLFLSIAGLLGLEWSIRKLSGMV